MSPDEDSRQHEILELADEVLRGTCSDSQAQRLEALLSEDPEARRIYLEYTFLHADLALTDQALVAGIASAGEAVGHPELAAQPRSLWGSRTAWLSGAAALAASVLIAVWLGLQSPATDESLAYYDQRDLPVAEVATVTELSQVEPPPEPSRGVSPSTLKLEKNDARLDFAGGAEVHLRKLTLFGLQSKQDGILYAGEIQARMNQPGAHFAVCTPAVRVVDHGKEYRVKVHADGETEVSVVEGEVEIQTRVRLPLFYWSFDNPEENFQDLVGGKKLKLGARARATDGLIGSGGLAFDNARDAFADVAGGTGREVGTGDFAVSHGITLETVILPKWSGDFGDYDEIFRKEDGNYRILLSFQHDNFNYDVPPVEPGPCLSFGLHLAGLGYSELDMPLDGREGRPTLDDLKDGRPHHVVATYDSFSGRKSLYIDGRLCYEHRFRQGAQILSGGSSPAVLGNLSSHREPFHGVIDEFAFYDFALRPEEVAAHYANVQQGENYFGKAAARLKGERWESLVRIAEGKSMRFDAYAAATENPR